MNDLKGKCGIIIGATSDIGVEIIKRFSKRQISQLIIHGRDQKKLDHIIEICKENNSQVSTILADLTDDHGIKKFSSFFKNSPSKIKIDYFLFCPGTCGEMDPVSYLRVREDIVKVMNINLTSAFKTFEIIQPYFNKGASAVFVSSTNSMIPLECGTAYCSSKAGLTKYAKAMSKELKDRHIRVNSVAPGTFASKFHNPYFESEEELNKFYKDHIRNTILGRIVTIDGVCNAIEFLMSDFSRALNGQEIIIDCGEVLYAGDSDSSDDNSSE